MTGEQHRLALARQQRYRDSHRETVRAKARAYQAEQRRAAGIPALDTPESTENRRRARKAQGDEHGNWKGGHVGYDALHAWVRRHKTKTGRCSECGNRPQTRTDWANVSREYKRELDDFVELCVPCHKRRDLGAALSR